MRAIAVASIGLLAAVGISSADPTERSDTERFRGTWVRAEKERDDAARLAEIDRVIQEKSTLFRAIARAVIRQRMKPAEWYEIIDEGGIYWIRSDAGERHPLDGRPHSGSEADEVVSWSEGSAIHQYWRFGESSHGAAIWRLNASASRLVITEQVHNSHFDEAIIFSTSYRRGA